LDELSCGTVAGLFSSALNFLDRARSLRELRGYASCLLLSKNERSGIRTAAPRLFPILPDPLESTSTPILERLFRSSETMSAFVRAFVRIRRATVVRNLKQQIEDLTDRNLKISEECRRYLRHESWSPIMGALLLSGIRPSPRWMDVPPTEGHRDDTPVSHKELFIELLSSLKVPERGLDNERILSKSHRFKSVENILLFWDHVCSVHADYLRISDEGDRPLPQIDRKPFFNGNRRNANG
jgi:hypothetical protein